MRCCHFIAILLTVAATALGGDPSPATGPTPLSIPPLVIAGEQSRSFVVSGLFRPRQDGVIGFRVAAQGDRQVCVLFDAADGTPMLLCNEHESLVYDLANSRIVRVPRSRVYVRVDWESEKAKPLTFTWGIHTTTKVEELKKSDSFFRIDRFVSASGKSLRRLDALPGVLLFAAERAGGHVESIQQSQTEPSFRFTSHQRQEADYALELEAAHIGDDPPDALTFPDMRKLGAQIAITDLDDQMLPVFVVMLQDGRAWLAKFGLAGGTMMREAAERASGKVDWEALRKRDDALGKRYRDALAKQGLVLRPLNADPATQPAPTMP